MSTGPLDQAVQHFRAAHEILSDGGMSEKYYSLAVDVGNEEWHTFYCSFKGDRGLLMSITSGTTANELIIRLTIRREKQKIWSRLKESFVEFFAVLFGKETEYELSLSTAEVTEFKNLLRVIP